MGVELLVVALVLGAALWGGASPDRGARTVRAGARAGAAAGAEAAATRWREQAGERERAGRRRRERLARTKGGRRLLRLADAAGGTLGTGAALVVDALDGVGRLVWVAAAGARHGARAAAAAGRAEWTAASARPGPAEQPGPVPVPAADEPGAGAPEATGGTHSGPDSDPSAGPGEPPYCNLCGEWVRDSTHGICGTCERPVCVDCVCEVGGCVRCGDPERACGHPDVPGLCQVCGTASGDHPHVICQRCGDCREGPGPCCRCDDCRAAGRANPPRWWPHLCRLDRLTQGSAPAAPSPIPDPRHPAGATAPAAALQQQQEDAMPAAQIVEWSNIQDAVDDADHIRDQVLEWVDAVAALALHSQQMPERAATAAQTMSPGQRALDAILRLAEATPDPAGLIEWAEAAHAASMELRRVQVAVGDPAASTGAAGRVEAFTGA